MKCKERDQEQPIKNLGCNRLAGLFSSGTFTSTSEKQNRRQINNEREERKREDVKKTTRRKREEFGRT